MMAWQNNTTNTYHAQDENMAYQQPPPIENYQGGYYPHSHPSPELINPNPQTAYPYATHSPPCFVPQQIYTPMDTMFLNPAGIPLSNAPSQSGINSMVQSQKVRYNSRDLMVTCSNCQQRNSLLESELTKKDDEIASLRHQNSVLQNRIQELEELLRQYDQRSSSETVVNNVLQPVNDYLTSSKITQLSPEAKEFNPEKTDKSFNSISPVIEVPIVSAKVFNDEPTHETQAEIIEETQAEEIEVEDIQVEEIQMSETLADKDHTEENRNIEMAAHDNQTIEDNAVPIAPSPDFENGPVDKEVDTQMTCESMVSQQEETVVLPEVADGTWEETQDPVTTSESNVPLKQDRNNSRIGDQQPSLESHNAQGKTRFKKPRDYGPSTSLTGGARGRGYRKGEQDYSNERSQQNYPFNRTGNSYSSNYGSNQRNQSFHKHQKHPDDQSRDFYRDNSRDRHKDSYPKENYDSLPRESKNGSSRDGFSREQREGGGPGFKDGFSREQREGGGPGKKWDKQPNMDVGNRDQAARQEEQNDEANLSQRNSSRGRGGMRSSWDHSSSKQPYHKRNEKGDSSKEQDNGFAVNSNRRPLKPHNIVKEMKEDLFNAPPDFSLVHCVAKDFRMGAGIAVRFRTEFKRVPELLDQNVDVGGCAYLEDKDRYIFYMVTKRVSSGKPTYDTFRDSLKNLKEKCTQFGVTKLAMPHIGCGLDRLDWSKVRQMINEIFQESDIHICAYDFNAEGSSEAEGNKPPPTGLAVKHQIMSLSSIDAQTALVFLGTEDGHVDSTATSLNNKFKFVTDYKTAPKTVGQVWCYTRLHDYYIYSLIVSKTSKEKVSFTKVDECCRNLSKMLRKDKFEYAGIEVFIDWSDDDTFTEKIVTLLRYTLPKGIRQLWVCYPDQKFDVHNMSIKYPSKQPQTQM